MVEKQFFVPASVKDMIEGIGVPHTEVDLVLVNGESSDFSRLVQNGDRVAVYPVFESIDIAPVLRLRPQPLRELRFVLDVHLGRLAGYLRTLGFDAVYSNRASDRFTTLGVEISCIDSSIRYPINVAIAPVFPGCRGRPGSERRSLGRSPPSPTEPRQPSCPESLRRAEGLFHFREKDCRYVRGSR